MEKPRGLSLDQLGQCRLIAPSKSPEQLARPLVIFCHVIFCYLIRRVGGRLDGDRVL